jgi:hypothetical protein
VTGDAPFGWKGREREAPEWQRCDVLLELDTLVHREQRVVLPTHAPKQIAELRPGQTDQDSLPPYPELDAILEAYVEGDQSKADIVARGFDEATVKRVIAMVDKNEYKRRQGPIGIKITPRAFGKDWRLPIVNRFQE